jgi:sucrose-6-phosphate hydrolase SacC (GH32 family)
MIWQTWDVEEFKGSTAIITIRDESKREWGFVSVDHFVQSDKRMYRDELYRPQFHFTPWVNWMNDPHGLVYYKGEYHLFFQHNPHARIEREATHNNTHWGHAVSSDLIYWKQLPNVLAPDELGLIFSGSAAVDFSNTAGFKTGDEDVILAFYSASKETQSQCLAYSNDMARTFTKYDGNPVIEAIEERRDPKAFWYEPDKKWVMVLYEHGGFGFYTSKDAKKWTKMSSYGHGTGYEDCADMFELPVDGDKENKKWVLHDGAVKYVLGQFDGTKFIADNPQQRVFNHGSYAYQTYNNIPASDGRTIQISWLGGPDWPDAPFNQQATFPCELNLRTFPEGIKVCRTPVREIELIYDKKHNWENLTIKKDENLLKDIKGRLFDIQAEFEIGNASEFGFKIRGDNTVSYDVKKNQAEVAISDKKFSEKMPAINKKVKMRILVDRSSIEAYIDDGRASFTTSFFPKRSNRTLQLFSKNGETKLISLDIHELKSAWDR